MTLLYHVAIIGLGCIFICSGGRYFANGISINVPEYEIQALHDLYNATNGPNWAWRGTGNEWDFSDNPNPCLDKWQGITCTNQTLTGSLHIEYIYLTGYQLIGTLPDSIGNFSKLTQLYLDSNSLYSTLPYTLYGLTSLQVLAISSNDFTGVLPNSLRNITTLQLLSIEQNGFDGPIPAFLCEMKQLQNLAIGYTDFSGPLLDCLGSLSSLISLDMSYAPLVGTIPASYGQLTQLTNLRLAQLQYLHGTIPDTFANLTKLIDLILDTNHLTGTIPAFMGDYASIYELSLVQNAFTGSIPASFANLSSVVLLYLHDNELNGTIPSGLISLPLLQILLLNNNQLSGSLTGSCGSTTALFKMELGYNYLTGTLPSTLSTCTALKILVVNNNHMHGPGLEILYLLPKLSTLYLGYNAFTGTIPEYIGTLNKLQYFLINNNLFGGTVPYAVFNNKTLIAVDIGGNFLHGKLPATLSVQQVSSMQAFVCGGNQLSGPIPSWLAYLTVAQSINLTSNHFTGTLPAFLTKLSLLSFLYASDNLLTGTLPPDWSGMPFLSFLYLDNNQFTSTIPASIGSLTVLQSLNLSSNYFTGSIPTTFAKLSQMQIMLLNNNNLRGTVQNAFNVTSQTSLATVQLSNNQFSGSLPSDIFRSNTLKVFAAVSNCFTGSIPLTLCNSSSINTLALDGLQSATSCRRALFPASLDGIVARGLYSIDDPLTGGVPACLFQMANLTTLHLSGNGLTGELPSDIVITPTLTDLSLSHNKLKGSVPTVMLNRDWTNLDLSYNRFTGDLQLDQTPRFQKNASFSLEQNRLSGRVPSAFQEVDEVSILEGNVFTCNTQRSDIPSQDPEYGKYQCGSNSLNESLYVWAGLGVLVVVLMGVIRRHSQFTELASHVQVWWTAGNNSGTTTVDQGNGVVSLGALVEVQARVSSIVQTTVTATLYGVIILLPLYAILTVYYGTYSEQYAWTASVAFLTSEVPFALCFTFLLLLLVIVRVLWVVFCKRSESVVQVEDQNQAEDISADAVSGDFLTQKRLTWLVYALFILLNFTIVLGVNIAYLVIALNKSDTVLVITQVCLALFKIGFNSGCTPYLIKDISHRVLSKNTAHMSEFMFVRLFVALVNNIVIPCFVVAIISPSCFYNVFAPAQEVSASYVYDGKCVVFDPQRSAFIPCLQREVLTATTSYDPPFQYSYQCSSSFITYYAPAYVIMCIIAAFVTPLLQVAAHWCYTQVASGTWAEYILRRAVPRIMRPQVDDKTGCDTTSAAVIERDYYRPYFDAAQHTITLLTYLGLLLTFGAVFPLLAVCFAFAIMSIAVFTRLKVGRFIVLTRNANAMSWVGLINAECEGVGNEDILNRSVVMILSFSCIFYTLFLFDTLADTNGIDSSTWVLIVVPLLPVLAYVVLFLCQFSGLYGDIPPSASSSAGDEGNSRDRLESVIEMEPAVAHRNPIHVSI